MPLKTAQEMLREADRRRDEFLAILAHELRNPLASARNAVQIFRMKAPVVPELQWAEDVIGRQLQHLTRLIDDLMEVSRVSQGKIVLKRERVELAAILHEAIEDSRTFIERCGHQPTVEVPAEPLYLEADPTRLVQIFCNLLNNAPQYTSAGGRIQAILKRQDSEAVVIIRDTGIGIPPEMLPKIFDLFAQVDRSMEKSQGGLGIGLTLVKQLVEMHGGQVEARSEGLGKGSEFLVRLPVLIETPALSTPRARVDGTPMPATAHRVLVVDDNRDAADSLALLMEMMGNEVRTAYDREDAVHAAGEFRPRIVLLDIGMPKLDGYDVARAIRNEPWGESMTLIAVTGWGQEEDQRRSKEAGFDRHLVKPVSPENLMRLVVSVPARPEQQLSDVRADSATVRQNTQRARACGRGLPGNAS